jgi:hypothetical protein
MFSFDRSYEVLPLLVAEEHLPLWWKEYGESISSEGAVAGLGSTAVGGTGASAVLLLVARDGAGAGALTGGTIWPARAANQWLHPS